MQVIYIDTLICVNLFIDYAILYVIKQLLHIYSRAWRLLPAAVFAGVSTVAVFLPFYTTLFSVIYRFAVAILTVLIAFGYKGIRKLLVRTLSFLGISMLLCGCVLMIELMWDPDGAVIYNDVLYFDISPVALILSTLTAFFALSIYQKLSERHKLSCRIRSVTVYINAEDKLTFESAVDTGCNLKEPFSGLPVIILEKEILGNIQLPQEKMRVIPYTTASGADIFMGFKPYKVCIDGKEIFKGCYIGICNNTLRGEIKSIMGAEISEAI